MPQPIRAIIFDCDGTLVDSETISLQVLVDLVAEFGVELSHSDALSRFSGQDLKLVFAELAPSMNCPMPDDFIDQFRERQFAQLQRSLAPIDGADDLLTSLDHPFCVASNAPISKMQICLNTTGLIRHFDDSRIFSAYQVNAWKPDPAVFLLAAETMGVSPSECLVVEDSVFGIDAGLAAGMQVLGYDPEQTLKADRTIKNGQLRWVRHLSEVGSFLEG